MKATDDWSELSDEEIVERFDSLLTQRFTEVCDSTPKLRYDAEGVSLLTEAFGKAWAELPDDIKRYVQERADAMTAEQWDAFAKAAIRPVQARDLFPEMKDEDET